MSEDDTKRTAGREDILAALRAELLGPAPAGKPLEKTTFADKDESYGPWTDATTGEEILDRAPLVRYGVGVLYPALPTATGTGGIADADVEEAARAMEQAIADAALVPGLSADEQQEPEPVGWEGSAGRLGATADDADFDLSGANERRPTAMGISFLLATQPQAGLRIEVDGGRYEQLRIDLPGGAQRTWWKRVPVKAVWKLSPEELRRIPHLHRDLTPESEESTGIEGLDLRLTASLRQHSGGTMTTVALVNRTTPGARALDAACLFQTAITATPQDSWLAPYPENAEAGAHPDDASFRLIYRHARTYAIGHGCSADWADPDSEGRSSWAKADPLPEYETPSITPDIVLGDGTALTVSMAQLAGTEPGRLAQLERILTEYKAWIATKQAEAATLEGEFQATAQRHIEDCSRALRRMREGLDLVRDADSDIGLAFRLANAAMLRQQLRSGAKLRTTTLVDGRFQVEGNPPDEKAAANNGRGNWRAFQIAFLLAAIPSTADPAHSDREAVDLIFFPTGGGKTEAYLGLSAFAMLLRRLRDCGDAGVTILMRYTLRLLTAQQFLRAAGLICALEDLRSKHQNRLGSERFSIGIWVGGDSTPNRNADAVAALRKLASDGGENPFLLLRCPWCAAQMGPVKSVESPTEAPAGQGRAQRGKQRVKHSSVAGYSEYSGRVVFTCPDPDCTFSTDEKPLPVYVVDDDVYDYRPSLVIGTIDKFAQLAWNPHARALFGLGKSGNRDYSPPGLVIQDELHLIAGPLGSMTGLYEGVIEELCTGQSKSGPIKPKIIASTATIRRHEEQVRALYARDTVRLFPPHGLDADDSFFAVYARDKTGKLLPGRKYVGVHAPALGSMQTTQVRSFAALLQAAKDSPEEQQDPWWTLMTFFNSLRELGNSLSLMQSDIPDYLKTINNRCTTDRADLRYLNRVEEMTSRLRQDQIPEAMEKLAQRADGGKAIDVCLASSLIEVGIDIDRLSLMAVVGQPKSTSQYIQVTGRVGRKWDKRPGLIVTLYGAAKPRDRSHFERFRSYHQRLYAQVEPTSATPFAPPALDRALHAAALSYIRQAGEQSLPPYPFPAALFDKASQILQDRVKECDPDEADRVADVLAKLRNEWENWEPTAWGTQGTSPELGSLMRAAGQYAAENVELSTWATPSSMRGADAECRAVITQQYALEGAKQ
ncbi:helicase-related protein [Streptacidiphilus melanogenes]|uniref:helicase-related protein n=1 Tax=Streptacidiphilus melanogenes TaxID=411235 RepID=UPI0005A65756|nr:helicase-related protein [Streptacidiphilus melanogenes]